jgi:hypothetical protein
MWYMWRKYEMYTKYWPKISAERLLEGLQSGWEDNILKRPE